MPLNLDQDFVLCLSGGGFRATFFHLGVIRFLRLKGRLEKLRHVWSVSGGSILAAHLALRWPGYAGPDEREFERVAKQLVDFGRTNVRGQVLDQWIESRRLQWEKWLDDSELSSDVQALYEELYERTLLTALPERPRFHILATSLTRGQACVFQREGYVRAPRDPLKPEKPPIQSATLSLARAVAASSAFPALFPPVRLESGDFTHAGQFGMTVEYLTDAGVFDNLGRFVARNRARAEGMPASQILISDASAQFDWDLDTTRWRMPQRVGRTTDVMMERVRRLEDKGASETVVSISKRAPEAGGLAYLVQDRLSKVRTDLDEFSVSEIRALVEHGFNTAKDKLDPKAPEKAWDPFPHEARPSADDWAAALKSSDTVRLDEFGRVRDRITRVALVWVIALFVLSGAIVLLSMLAAGNLQTTRDSTTTRYVGTFPENMGALNGILRRAEGGGRLFVLTDFAGYGSYSTPKQFDAYKELLLRLLPERIRLKVYAQPKAEQALETQFRESPGERADFDRIRQTDSFKEYFKHRKPFFAQLPGPPRVPPGELRQFFQLLMAEEGAIRAELRTRDPAAYRETEEKPPLFLWLRDDKEAVFSFSTGKKDVSFVTRDPNLLRILTQIYESQQSREVR